MSQKRLLVMGCDNRYYEYTVIAICSFLKHNPDWRVLVMDVGMTPPQVKSLQAVAQVTRFPREEFRPSTGFYIPTAKARCLALAKVPSDGSLMLYLDGDTLTLGSIEPLIEQFLCSGKPIGIASEDDPRFFTASARTAWQGDVIPNEFSGRDRWAHLPMLNTGVLLAVGQVAADVGQKCINLYETFKSRFKFGEQTIINAVLYEDQVGLFALPTRFHCFLPEQYLQRTGNPYVDPVLLNGTDIVIRHFSHKSKDVLDSLKSTLLLHYDLKSADRSLLRAIPNSQNPTAMMWTETLARAEHLFRAGQLNEMDGICHSVLATAPKVSEAHRFLGLAEYTRGNLVEAVSHLRNALALAPGHAVAHDNLSLILLRLDSPIEAEAEARQAMALQPKLASAPHNLGLALMRQNRFVDASIAFHTATELAPNDANVWNSLAAALWKLERHDEVRRALERALQLQPDSHLTRENLQRLRTTRSQ